MSQYRLPLGAWSESYAGNSDGILPGQRALSSFLRYVESSRRLLEESGALSKSELSMSKFIKGVKGELENLGKANTDFLAVEVYVP